MRADDRVLAIMMKAPRAGRVKTRLAAAYPPERVVDLYRAMVADTLSMSRRIGVRTAAVCPADDASVLAGWLPSEIELTPQRGVGLAAGLQSTFEQLCSDDGKRVIALDADSPHIPASAIESAFEALRDADLVVGPCEDGGYYLVGARRPHANLFDARALGGESACDVLLAAADRLQLRVALGAVHYDVDVPEDLVRLAQELAEAPLRAPLTAALLAQWDVVDDTRQRPRR